MLAMPSPIRYLNINLRANIKMKMNFRQITELLLTTGIMTLIMSGMMMTYHFGFNETMLKMWKQTYPVAWAVAIPGIMTAKKIVRFLMGILFKSAPLNH